MRRIGKVTRIDLCAFVQQKRHCLDVLVKNGCFERSVIDPFLVDIDSAIKEREDSRAIAFLDGIDERPFGNRVGLGRGRRDSQRTAQRQSE